MHWKFKEQNSFENRKHESFEIVSKYPDRIPVILQKSPHGNINEIDRSKFLVPYDCTVAQFQWTIRKRAKMSANKAIFLFVNKTLPQAGALMGEIYQQHKDEDGFLYMVYSGENTFGF